MCAKLKLWMQVFGMWINDKLVKSGNPAIRVADLEQELQGDTFTERDISLG